MSVVTPFMRRSSLSFEEVKQELEELLTRVVRRITNGCLFNLMGKSEFPYRESNPGRLGENQES